MTDRRTPNRSRRELNDEVARLSEPLVRFATRLRVHRRALLVVGLALYGASGVTVIRASDVGVVYRAGTIVGANDGRAVHQPGLLLTLPLPLDQVRRVPVDAVDTLHLTSLHGAAPEDETIETTDRLDPEEVGYVLTGDRNIFHARLVVRYKIDDPVSYLVGAIEPRDVLRVSVLSAAVQTIASTRLDALLGPGRSQFIRTITAKAQQRLDRLGIGLQLVSVEVDDFSPPPQVASEFDAVQSAFIASQTASETADRYATQTIAEAHANARDAIARAEADAAQTLSRARGETQAFRELVASYRANPQLVRDRLYNESIETALSRSNLVGVPPPINGRYAALRLLVSGPSAPRTSRIALDEE
ncbi:MAG: SPFH domain-containing protein [Myxococcota bacterium]